MDTLSTTISEFARVTHSSRPDSSQTEGEIPLVTNENRKQYVKDYIAQLAGRFVHRQPKTFVSGFLTTISRRSVMVCHDPPPSLIAIN